MSNIIYPIHWVCEVMAALAASYAKAISTIEFEL
jgi:hypothetical protein